ncbi:unnamed protein product [Adineta ricciae]|uniref:Uncharacterized protein n=1 Tax=Adineta ricciae TaxID=249248 RepID=A0A815MJF6_ADIRI|nr:unnamed protein product [Adineta ricciae]
MHQHHRRATNDCYEQMMIHELKLKKCKLSRLYRMVRNFKALICLDLYHLHTCRVDRINHRIVASKELEIKENHQNKLNKFRNKQRPANELNKSTLSPITNPSKRILTDKEISILENGLNFVLPTDKFDEMTFISNIEAFFVELLGHYIDKRDYEEKDVDEKIKYNLTPIQLQFANRTDRRYGPSKVHQAGTPLRPVVSASGTFNYKLAKLLTLKLDHLRKSDSIIKDTFTFVDELRSLKFYNPRIKLISFDIH